MEQNPLAQWRSHFALGITGHRPNNPDFAANKAAITEELSAIFNAVQAVAVQSEGDGKGAARLHSLLALGVDQIAANLALENGWDLIAPLPFGANLNLAINSDAGTIEDVAALCDGKSAPDAATQERAASIAALADKSQRFEIGDRDEDIRALLDRTLTDPSDAEAQRKYEVLTSEHFALAARVMIERSDLLIAVWDRKRTDLQGGTGHTVLTSLEAGTPVLVMDVAKPDRWTIITRPEELGHIDDADRIAPDRQGLERLAKAALNPEEKATATSRAERWRPKSAFGFGVYRHIETLFGGRTVRSGTVKSRYESPDDIATGSAAKVIEAAGSALGPDDTALTTLRDKLLPTFAWADGVSSRLSDAYRSGMVINFILSAFAIIAGVAYIPFDLAQYKWIFASVELGLLVTILLITYAGSRRKWHLRWFETRRVAEYLRFAPALSVLGVARPIGRWPRGETSAWPERFSRDALREAGLPAARIDRAYLHRVLEEIVLPHVDAQLTYHEAKSKQLARVHHRIDKSAEACFLAAVVSVSIYLAIELGAALGMMPQGWPYAIAKAFTFMGVAFPTLGANLAGIRYFGDFERFSAISNATAGQLADVKARIELLLSAEPARLNYKIACEVVQSVDAIIVGEIESWQSVFGAKHLTLPA